MRVWKSLKIMLPTRNEKYTRAPTQHLKLQILVSCPNDSFITQRQKPLIPLMANAQPKQPSLPQSN